MPWPVTIKADDRPALAKAALQRYLDGERIEDIAIEHGLSRKSLYAYLTDNCEEDWKHAQVGAAIDRLEKAKALMDSATDMLDITRARESARLAQWDLERVCRRIYGTDTPPGAGSGIVQINISVGPTSEPVQVLSQPQE